MDEVIRMALHDLVRLGKLVEIYTQSNTAGCSSHRPEAAEFCALLQKAMALTRFAWRYTNTLEAKLRQEMVSSCLGKFVAACDAASASSMAVKTAVKTSKQLIHMFRSITFMAHKVSKHVTNRRVVGPNNNKSSPRQDKCVVYCVNVPSTDYESHAAAAVAEACALILQDIVYAGQFDALACIDMSKMVRENAASEWLQEAEQKQLDELRLVGQQQEQQHEQEQQDQQQQEQQDQQQQEQQHQQQQEQQDQQQQEQHQQQQEQQEQQQQEQQDQQQEEEEEHKSEHDKHSKRAQQQKWLHRKKLADEQLKASEDAMNRACVLARQAEAKLAAAQQKRATILLRAERARAVHLQEQKTRKHVQATEQLDPEQLERCKQAEAQANKRRDIEMARQEKHATHFTRIVARTRKAQDKVAKVVRQQKQQKQLKQKLQKQQLQSRKQASAAAGAAGVS